MRGDWDNQQFLLARSRRLRFTAQQAELIRAHLRDTVLARPPTDD